MNHRILLVDDEQQVLDGLTRVLHKEPYDIVTANTAEEAATILDEHAIDLIVCDEEMPGMRGTEFLARVATESPDIVRIVLTGNPSLPAALRAINDGKVYQFFTKPCNEIDLAITIRRALDQKDLTGKTRELLEVTKRQSGLIDEARMLRRMRDVPRKKQHKAFPTQGRPSKQRELLDEIDEEVRKGRELLKDMGNRPAVR